MEASEVHGITNDMVASAPSIEDIAPKLIESLEKADCFVAYNALFDFQFLQSELYRAAKYDLDEANFIFLDPYKIFKKMFPHNLANAYRYYTGKEMEGAHDAMVDIKATQEILTAQEERYQELFELPYEELAKQTIGDTSILGRWFDVNNGQVYFHQGKYKGQALDVAEHGDYMAWIFKLPDITISERRFIKDSLQHTNLIRN